MDKAKIFSLVAAFALAALFGAFMLSCSEDSNAISGKVEEAPEYPYCVYDEEEICLTGPYIKVCGEGGELRKDCDYEIIHVVPPDDGTPRYAYCVYDEEEICLTGPYIDICGEGGELTDNCPFIRSSSSAASVASSSSTATGGDGSSSSTETGGGVSSSSSRVSSSSRAQASSSSKIEIPPGTISEGCDPPITLNGTKYGSDLIDNRNGETKTYKTVIIGTQTWMAANLNYKPSSGKTKCYAQGGGNGQDEWLKPEEAEINCVKFGRLYDWAAAKTACPDGWHLPTDAEWATLKKLIEDEIYCNYEDIDYGWDVGSKLKATANWKAYAGTEPGITGVDSYGFKAIGSGYCANCGDQELTSTVGYYAGGPSKNNPGGSNGEEAHWWSATEYVNTNNGDKSQAYKYDVHYYRNVMNRKSVSKTEYLYSVRCVKN